MVAGPEGLGKEERDGNAAGQCEGWLDMRGPTPKLDRLQAIYQERAAYFLKGHQPAMDFVWSIFTICHVWDDLIDRDRHVTDEEIQTAFWQAVVTLPTNPFYVQHFATLYPVFVTTIVNWRAATAMERRGEEADREIAFILRAGYADLLTMSALLVGGVEWSIRVTPEIRQWMHEESYAEYRVNLQQEEVRRCR